MHETTVRPFSSYFFYTAIQLAKLTGFWPIITTASLQNQALLPSLGATHVFDRHLPNAMLKERVRERVTGPLTYIFDAVSCRETQQVDYDLLAPDGTLAVVSQPHVGGSSKDDKSGKRVCFRSLDRFIHHRTVRSVPSFRTR